MELGLKDKTAIVSASSAGLGKAIAMELCREGARFDKPTKVCYPEFSQNNKHRGANSG